MVAMIEPRQVKEEAGVHKTPALFCEVGPPLFLFRKQCVAMSMSSRALPHD